MKVIRLSLYENDSDVYRTRFAGTLADAKVEARAVPQALRSQVLAEEVEVQTDKAGIIAMLNSKPLVIEVQRTWGITARGALVEE
jgi:hypothetical protein